MKRDNSQVQSSGCSYNNRLQLPAPTARDRSCRHFPSPLLRSFHGASPAINAGECNVRRRGGPWGSIRMNVDRHRGLQAQRGTDTFGTQHSYGNGARASPTPRASRAGVTIMTMASEHGRVILPLGACRSTRYVPIGNERPSRAPVTAPAVARFRSQELTDPGTQN